MSESPRQPEERGAANDADARTSELAARFAAGDLDEPGLRELYARLRAPGSVGRDAAALTWDVIGATTDLRSALGSTFQDTVRHRLDAIVAGASGEGGFVDGVKSKLGLERPSLRVVAASGRSAHDRPATAIPLIGAIVAGAIVVVVALVLSLATGGERRENVADAVWAKAPVSVEARPVTTGAHLDRRTVVIGPDGRLVVAWPAGHRATIDGPSTLSPQGGGLSLASGTAWVETAGAFTLGLPDMQVVAAGKTKFTVQVQGEDSSVGVTTGELLLKRSPEGPGTKLIEGHASSGPDRQYEWETEPHWTTTHTGSRLLVSDATDVAWRFRARVLLSSRDDAVVFQGLTGAPAAGVQAGSLILRDAPTESGEAMVRTATGGRRLLGQRIPLKGAPLVERTVTLTAAPGAHPQLTVTGLESAREGLTIKIGCPFEVMLYGEGRLEAIEFHVGPPPTPGE